MTKAAASASPSLPSWRSACDKHDAVFSPAAVDALLMRYACNYTLPGQKTFGEHAHRV
tara:strand:+ start:399 stop:572 length:174 start_codon:yes stop_codon:yes gene_type:complete